MVRLGKSCRHTGPSCGKNRRSRGSMAFWKTSSETPLKRRTAKKGSREKSFFPFWNEGWTIPFTGWVLPIRVTKHVNWCDIAISCQPGQSEYSFLSGQARGCHSSCGKRARRLSVSWRRWKGWLGEESLNGWNWIKIR